MATTTSTTTNFSSMRYAQQIRQEMLDFGPIAHVFRQLADVGKLEPGHSNTYQVNRRKRIALPLVGASEGTAPSATTLGGDFVQGTATQYVLVVQFTDVAEIYQFHDLLEDATIEVKDAMARLDDKIMSDSYVAATNIIYPGSISTISSITSADILNTNMIRRGVSNLRTGDNQYFGAAPRFAGDKMAAIIHEKAIMDLQQDATWDQYASRQRPELLEKGAVNDWEGVIWYKTNFMPEYTNLGTTEVGVGSSSADAGAGASTFNGTQQYVITRKSQLRTFEEGISGVLTSASVTNTHKLSITTPTDATGTYVYNIYLNSTNGGSTLKLAASNVASATVTTFTDVQATGATAPVAPASGVTVLPCFILGKGAISTVDLSALEIFITPRTPTPTDPAVQNRYVAAKFFLGSFVQQQAWIRLLYAATSQ
jgi:N4-gp56 family major capsid protein